MDSSGTLATYGLTPVWQARFEATKPAPDSDLGRVVRQDRGHVLVVTETATQLVKLQGRNAESPLVGDWVVIGNGSVEKILERTSMLSRQSSRSVTEQGMAANVDVVFIVCGLDRPVKKERIERALTQTWQSGATPIVVLSKSDLVENANGVAGDLSTSLNVEVITVASKLGAGLDAIKSRMSGKTTVLIGESGAGKSTLSNALMNEEVTKTGKVRESDSKGRHTTTRRELHPTPFGCLIDTPGIRSIGLWADAESVQETFADIVDLADQCRFSNCAHEGEPGCQITAAVERDELDIRRLDAWRDQMSEVAANELRASEHEKRKNERRYR